MEQILPFSESSRATHSRWGRPSGNDLATYRDHPGYGLGHWYPVLQKDIAADVYVAHSGSDVLL